MNELAHFLCLKTLILLTVSAMQQNIRIPIYGAAKADGLEVEAFVECAAVDVAQWVGRELECRGLVDVNHGEWLLGQPFAHFHVTDLASNAGMPLWECFCIQLDLNIEKVIKAFAFHIRK